MSKFSRVAGLAGSVLLASPWMAQAQDAQPTTQDQQAQAQPAPAQPCSLLGCMFSGSQSPAPQAEPAPASDAAQASQSQPDGQGPQAQQDSKVQQDQAQQDYESPQVAPSQKLKPKPIHPVTIAADVSEIGRLKGLVAAMPKGKVKIVPAATVPQADFSISTDLDQHESGQKAKLFTEQMHIVAGGQILSVADLKDKVVSFGPDKSASQSAARAAFAALNIPVKETPLDLDNALDGLSTGDVAAVVVLAPQPFARFAKLTAPGLHLVSWPQDGAIPAGAVSATIEAADYPGLAKPDATIRAVGVDAVLKISTHGQHQPACKTFLTALAQHSAALSKRGFDLLKADIEGRAGRNFASADPR